MSGQGSLVKYNTPILVSTTNDKSKGSKKKGAQAANEKQTSQTEDILNSILPPRSVRFYFKDFFLIFPLESGRKMVIFGFSTFPAPLRRD